MRIEVYLDGMEYVGVSNEDTADDASSSFHANIGVASGFRMNLIDGSWLVLGKDACQRAHFIFTN
jgi:hypothetical protein